MTADYDYTDAGLDSFLSRSIDNLNQSNLDAGGPQSATVAYDRFQFDGKAAAPYRIGQARIDEKGFRFAKEGADVDSNDSTDFSFDSRNNLFKIREVKAVYTLTEADITNLFAEFSFAHNAAGQPELVLGRVSIDPDRGREQPLPYMFNSQNTAYGTDPYSFHIHISKVDDTSITCRVDSLDLAGFSVLNSRRVLTFTFFCLEQTNAVA